MLSTKLRAVSLAALVAFLGCNSSGGSSESSATDYGRASSDTPRQFGVTHTNTKVGAPSFVWLSRSDWPAFDSADVAAKEILTAVAPTFRLEQSALATISTGVIHDTGRGPILARFAQRLDGVDVFRGGLNVVMSRRFEPVAASGLVAANIELRQKGFERDALAALAIAHRTLTGKSTTFSALDVQGDYQRFSSAVTRLDQPARAKRVYFPTKTGLEPGWFVELLLASGVSHTYVVSASSGRILWSNNLVRQDAYTYRVWASPDTKLPMDGPQGNAAVPLVTPTRSGFKPTFVPQELVTLQNFPFSKNDPWLPPGATTTVGNNVRAYSDVAPGDGFTNNTADAMATTTSDATFDYVYDTSVSAGTTPAAVRASITQMFYEINFLHDWFYDAGFDEKSGNHQKSNFGRGGVQNDALLAETQDFSGRNNANASTPPDGASPRIQMYLFGGATNASLDVAVPAPNAGTKTVGSAGQFGSDSFDFTAPVVFTADGGGVDPNDGCENIGSSLAGKIALVHRGNCAFVVKAQKVQAAGGAGIIIVNVPTSSQPNSPPFMGGTALDVTIPALSLALADGNALKAAIAAGGATVTMKREPSKDLDGALDEQIVAHEWGHVLSNRLVADGSGLDTNQAGGLGEGWGDFTAMLLGVREDDALVASNANWSGVYPSAAYATSGGGEFYFGIRRLPYSTDLKKNPLTLKHISNGEPLPSDVPVSFGEDGSSNAEVHNTGEVWASMLWECYASLLSSGRLSFKEAQDRMKGYLVASLKLTPPSPTLLEARDAVLAAAFAAEPKEHKDFDAFWKAFAKRGAGVGALGPASDSNDNTGVKESFVVGNAAALVSLSVKDDVITCDHDGIVDEGEVGTIVVTIRNSGAGTLKETTATLSSKSTRLSFVDKGVVKFDAFQPFETKTAMVKAYIDGVAEKDPLIVDIEVDDPSMVAGGALHVTLPTRHGVDELADSSTIDTVETTSTSWVVTGEDQFGTSAKWDRVALKDGNKVWFIPNAGEPADHQLTSPAFEVTDSTFTLSFKHRWSFESSVKDMKDFDGGVVEITTNGGKTWEDISLYGKIDYNVTLEDDPQTTMVLKGRKAFGHESPGYPDKWVTTVVEVTLKEPQATAKIRFRHGADDNSASVGWEIDDIEVSGLTNTPFWSLVPQRDECDPNGPTAIAPPGQTTTSKTIVQLLGSGTHPKSLPLGFSWRQAAGPTVFLSGRDTPELAFEAPDTKEPVTLTFTLRANDGALLSAPASVDVVVNPPSSGERESDGCGCRVVSKTTGDSRVLWTAGLAGLALVLVRRRRRERQL